MIFTDHLDEIDSSQSYYKVFLCNQDALVIAFINLGISNHILNEDDSLKYIEKCYVICYSIDFLKINNEVVFDNKIKSPLYYFGGLNLGSDRINEIEIRTSKLILKICNNSRIQQDFFIPIDTPYYKLNMKKEEVDFFIEGPPSVL